MLLEDVSSIISLQAIFYILYGARLIFHVGLFLVNVWLHREEHFLPRGPLPTIGVMSFILEDFIHIFMMSFVWYIGRPYYESYQILLILLVLPFIENGTVGFAIQCIREVIIRKRSEAKVVVCEELLREHLTSRHYTHTRRGSIAVAPVINSTTIVEPQELQEASSLSQQSRILEETQSLEKTDILTRTDKMLEEIDTKLPPTPRGDKTEPKEPFRAASIDMQNVSLTELLAPENRRTLLEIPTINKEMKTIKKLNILASYPVSLSLQAASFAILFGAGLIFVVLSNLVSGSWSYSLSILLMNLAIIFTLSFVSTVFLIDFIQEVVVNKKGMYRFFVEDDRLYFRKEKLLVFIATVLKTLHTIFGYLKQMPFNDKWKLAFEILDVICNAAYTILMALSYTGIISVAVIVNKLRYKAKANLESRQLNLSKMLQSNEALLAQFLSYARSEYLIVDRVYCWKLIQLYKQMFTNGAALATKSEQHNILSTTADIPVPSELPVVLSASEEEQLKESRYSLASRIHETFLSSESSMKLSVSADAVKNIKEKLQGKIDDAAMFSEVEEELMNGGIIGAFQRFSISSSYILQPTDFFIPTSSHA